MIDPRENPNLSTQPNQQVSLEQLRSALQANQGGILTTTRQRLARIAQARGIASGVIDDVVQDTLVEAWTHLDRLRNADGFRLWIDEICRNICRRADRQHQQGLLREAAALHDDFTAEASEGSDADRLLNGLPAPAQFDPVEELSRQDLIHLLDRAFGSLPAPTREVLQLCYVVDLPRDEVAGRLGISSGTLDTRLHRARAHMRQVLSGPLRSEAEAFDMALNDVSDDQWQVTRMWCPLCARRLEGCFVHRERAAGPNLHLRCPNCSLRQGRDTVHSMSLVSLDGLHAFRPAWKRTMQGLSDTILASVAKDWAPCLLCGTPTQFKVVASDRFDSSSPSGMAPFLIRGMCNKCGYSIDTEDDPFPSLDQLLSWSHSRTRQFVLQHPRWTSRFGEEIEHGGSLALTFHLADRESADQLTLVANRHTLRIVTLE